MKTIAVIALNGILRAFVFMLYLGVRAMKAPMFWVNIPKWKEWQKIEGNEMKTKQFQKDIVRLATVIVIALSWYYVAWWLSTIELLIISVVIFILFIKHLHPSER